MNFETIKRVTNIYRFPSQEEYFLCQDTNWLVIGDLHGNMMKLLYSLMTHGIAKGLSEEDYQVILGIYSTPETSLSKDDLVTFTQTLEKIKWDVSLNILLLGDELDDRGSNDYFTFKLFEKMHQNKVHYEILLSNHGMDFIMSYEVHNKIAPYELQGIFSNSLQALGVLFERKLVDRSEITQIIDRAYRPKLKSIHYLHHSESNELFVFTHAPVGLKELERFAKFLRVEFDDSSIEALTQTIDEINLLTQKLCEGSKLHYLLATDGDPSRLPFVKLIDNRNQNELKRPYQHHNYKIRYGHGHDDTIWHEEHIHNLDSSLGKVFNPNIQGDYLALLIQGHPKYQKTCKKDENTTVSDPNQFFQPPKNTDSFQSSESENSCVLS